MPGVQDDLDADLTLRAATTDDADEVAELLAASRRVHLPFLPTLHDADEDRAWVRGTLLPENDVVVAELGGRPVGVLATAASDGCSWLEQLYLAPGFTGRGIGTRLLEHALARLAGPVRLWTFAENAGARRFYERHGFRAIRFGDGRDNEEGCPDVLYELGPW